MDERDNMKSFEAFMREKEDIKAADLDEDDFTCPCPDCNPEPTGQR